MESNWLLTCLCEDAILDITLDDQLDHRCVWMDEEKQEPFLILKKEDIWWIEDGTAMKLRRQPLRLHQLYPCVVHEKPAALFCEPLDEGRQIFQLYQLDRQRDYTIGRSGCDINYDSVFLSKCHGELFVQENAWWIKDCDSRNGIYHNQRKVELAKLAFGDVLYFMGMWMFIGDDWIAINNPMFQVTATTPLYQPHPSNFVLAKKQQAIMEYDHLDEVVQLTTRTLLPPPNQEKREAASMLYLLGPSMTMGLASIMSAVFMIRQSYASNATIQQAIPSLFMAISMCMGTMVWPYALQRHEKKKAKQKEATRKQVYEEYLYEVKVDIEAELQSYQAWFKDTFSKLNQQSLSKAHKQLASVSMICLGYGDQSIAIPWVNNNPRQITLQQDQLFEKMEQFQRKTWDVFDLPYVLAFGEFSMLSLLGNANDQMTYALYVLYHLVTVYSPNQLRVVIATKHREVLRSLRFLPHLFEGDIRCLCENEQQIRKIIPVLKEESKPIVILSHTSTFTQAFLPLVKQGFVFLLALHEVKQVPQLVVKDNVGQFQKQTFHYETIPLSKFRELAQRMAPQLEEGFPEHVGFLSLYHVHDVMHLEIEKRWRNAEPDQSLCAALGVYANREVCMLDLHEKAHGPHGILAGMTGSGKSELLLTLLLSLAVSYHPQDVSFLLIDYKGGGMAKTLEGLPHTAGIITNLDGSMIERSLCALQSEMERRQRMLLTATQKTQASSMDIYHYQKLRRQGTSLDPMPHLIIAADEFAELKQQQPEFMQQLIRLARIGRSLGIHLLLATQKPSGVVDDQIWSNAHFHLCMKVAEKSDSMEMLKREDGALLKTCGRFFLQVGYDELFEEGQAAYVRTPYADGTSIEAASIWEMDALGNEKLKWNRNSTSASTNTEYQAILAQIQMIAHTRSLTPYQVWMPPLLSWQIAQEQQFGQIALVDDPLHQRQFPLSISLNDWQNTLLYASDVEESAFAISTILYTLCAQYDASQLKIMMLNFAQSDVQELTALHQLYAMISEEEIMDMEYLFHQLQTALQQRKHQGFTQHILLVMHSFALFEPYVQKYEDLLLSLLRDGNRYGIHIMVTLQSSNELRSRYQTYFTQRFCFALTQEQAYLDLLGTRKLLPKCFGRAFWKVEEVYEVQFAQLTKEMKQVVEQRSKQGTRQQMPMLPHELTWKQVQTDKCIGADRIPIGINLQYRSIVQISTQYTWLLMGMNVDGFQRALQQLCAHYKLAISIHPITSCEASIDIEQPAQFLILPSNLFTTHQYRDWFQELKGKGRILWVGSGLKEFKYQMNITEDFEDAKGYDGFWIHDGCEAIRFMKEET